MTDLTVKAAAGVRVPQEDNARRYITDAESATVPDTAYYRRRVRDGDLILVTPDSSAPVKPPVTVQADTSLNNTKSVSKEVTDGQS